MRSSSTSDRCGDSDARWDAQVYASIVSRRVPDAKSTVFTMKSSDADHARLPDKLEHDSERRVHVNCRHRHLSEHR